MNASPFDNFTGRPSGSVFPRGVLLAPLEKLDAAIYAPELRENFAMELEMFVPTMRHRNHGPLLRKLLRCILGKTMLRGTSGETSLCTGVLETPRKNRLPLPRADRLIRTTVCVNKSSSYNLNKYRMCICVRVGTGSAINSIASSFLAPIRPRLRVFNILHNRTVR